jgi:hypothetical protein
VDPWLTTAYMRQIDDHGVNYLFAVKPKEELALYREGNSVLATTCQMLRISRCICLDRTE